MDFKDDCHHKSVIPAFDEQEAGELSATEVQRRWPRFQGRCPECNQNVIVYASASHYILGDW